MKNHTIERIKYHDLSDVEGHAPGTFRLELHPKAGSAKTGEALYEHLFDDLHEEKEFPGFQGHCTIHENGTAYTTIGFVDYTSPKKTAEIAALTDPNAKAAYQGIAKRQLENTMHITRSRSVPCGMTAMVLGYLVNANKISPKDAAETLVQEFHLEGPTVARNMIKSASFLASNDRAR